MRIKAGEHVIEVHSIYETRTQAEGYMREALCVQLAGDVTKEQLNALAENPWEISEGEEVLGVQSGYNVLVRHEAVFAKVQTKQEEIDEAMRPVLDVLTDKQAMGLADKFPAWRAGVAYAAGARVSHEGVLYKVVQAHTSQEDWTPDIVPALFAVVTGEEAI